METVLESQTKISSPAFDNSGLLYFCSPETGDINLVDGTEIQTVGNTNGVPNSVTFDSNNTMYICDLARQAILQLSENGEIVEFINEYDGKPFVGPNQLVFNRNGAMYFTDSGAIGETSIQNPKGSVFCTNGDQIQPLAYECLAHPSGIALSPSEDLLYVAETMQNRILRFAQKPIGVFHCSVFHQFSGGFGPMALACDSKGNLHVSNFDFADVENTDEGQTGQITILKPDGKVQAIVRVKGSEINGLVFDNEKKNLYLSENSHRTIYKAAVGK